MHLRKLEIKDAPLMLEWMHDPNVVGTLRADFQSKTLLDAEDFIRNSNKASHAIHFAIASDEDEYMGTVSLREIACGSAEFAIAIRSSAMGRGYSWFGMEAILDKAFNELGLESVYWCVSRENARAIRFYDKHNFNEVLDIPKNINDRYIGVDNLKWYLVLRDDNNQVPSIVSGCKVIHIKTIIFF